MDELESRAQKIIENGFKYGFIVKNNSWEDLLKDGANSELFSRARELASDFGINMSKALKVLHHAYNMCCEDDEEDDFAEPEEKISIDENTLKKLVYESIKEYYEYQQHASFRSPTAPPKQQPKTYNVPNDNDEKRQRADFDFQSMKMMDETIGQGWQEEEDRINYGNNNVHNDKGKRALDALGVHGTERQMSSKRDKGKGDYPRYPDSENL